MTNNQEKIIQGVLVQIDPSEVVDEDRIASLVQVFRTLNPVSDGEAEEVVKELHSRLSVRMDKGACVKEKNHITWYYSAKKSLPSKFWERYKLYLLKELGFNPDVVNALDNSTDEMMDMLGDPRTGSEYLRRGLVIGDVQSGKTSTYTALINKAADAEYKIFILLTGTIEKLRRQTQGRLDSGFVGLDSTVLIRDKDNVTVGVGNIDPSVEGWAITSTSSDFNKKTAEQFNGRLSSISSPVIFVLKKNKSVLEKLQQWLRVYNADVDGKIRAPMLLIDDEADNASVNTKKEDDSPTAINAGIRSILKLFTRANYVAFTATPFANIFINPDSEDEMLKDDLFPRDFIYALEPPTNYIGARDIFKENGMYHFMLKTNDDCEFYLPEKHKKEDDPGEMPESLKEAIASFFIANAIRDLRGHNKTHRSMLINISRFINVQEKIRKQVDGYVRDMQRVIKLYYMMGSLALEHEEIAFIKDVYEKHYETLPSKAVREEKTFKWDEIQKALHEAVASIVVRTVNGGNAANNLNYDENEEDGLRLIAIGGFSLSRGLTLEGLCVSYFYRNSKMYDTLMQMGRWFGYRSHYSDLCQIWMSERSQDWYEYISDASDELRREVRKMRDLGLTPENFGLGVRSDKDSLLVTAINKMRYTEKIPVTISLDGEVVETPYIHMDPDVCNQNYSLTKKWISDLVDEGYEFADHIRENLCLSHPQILNVDKNRIIEYLRMFKSHYLNLDFRTEDLIHIMNTYNDGTIDNWDVMIAGGSGATDADLCGKTVKTISRMFAIKKERAALQLSGKGARLGSANLAKGGLTIGQKDAIEKAALRFRSPMDRDKQFSEDEYFNSGVYRNPLLVIYPITLKSTSKDSNGKEFSDPEKETIINSLNPILIGLSIGIPSVDGKERKKFKYRINLVKWRELLDVDDDYLEEMGLE